MVLKNSLYISCILIMVSASSAKAQLSTTATKDTELAFVVSRLDMLAAPPTLLELPKAAHCQLTVKKMPIFCHIEHKMSQNSGIPVRIRLGNVQYVDQLEGKTKYTK